MRLTDIAEITVSHLIGRFMRRAAGFALAALLAVITFYYASAAGTVALALQFGTLYAYLIMAGIYAATVLIVMIVLWATRAKAIARQDKVADALASPRNMQIAMLVEAVMLGYSLARKSGKPIL
ncbi:MAG TPA: hypothetical protein VFC54_10800 [Pseudolabrys sp.]|nr:hypothetical protein [Pseudolabrys sp.]